LKPEESWITGNFHLKQETYRQIVSGSNQSTKAGMLRVLFHALGLLYGLVISIRNRLYDWGILKSFSVDVPVICIGNLTAGGTGKTPLVIWLCHYLNDKGLNCAILTRGYKTTAGQMTDEPALLAKACGNVAVVVNSDRIAGARKAIEQHKAQVLILDDGFQHRRLMRDMDIVAVDATCPFGYGHILPAGLLRESPKSLKRASMVIITRSNQIDPQKVQSIEEEIHGFNPDLPIAKTVHQLKYAATLKNEKIPLEKLTHKSVYAFCGIGNPEAFFLSLRQARLNIVETQIFDDHHTYTQEDMTAVYEQARECGAKIVLCTQKDWVKSALLAKETDDFVFGYLAMELDFVDGFDKISRQLDKVLERVKDRK